MFYQKTLLNCRGKLLDLSTPGVMGILNVTPDSFYDGGMLKTEDDLLKKAEAMLEDGAAILDVGGASTRPGAARVPEEEELARAIPAVDIIHRNFPECIISIDTFRSRVAEEAVAAGAGMINDVSAGSLDGKLWDAVAKLKVPYVLMHMQGHPETMQQNPGYEDAVKEVFEFLKNKILQLNQLDIHDIIIDPGFGFGKSTAHNFQLLANLPLFDTLGLPVLAGISRKSMICKVLQLKPAAALNGSTALHAAAIMKGASLLRVHDVKEAMEVIRLIGELRKSETAARAN